MLEFLGHIDKKLCELLHDQDGKYTHVGYMLPAHAPSEVGDRETTTILLSRRTRTTKKVE